MIVDIYSGEVLDHDEKAENVLVRIRDGLFTSFYSTQLEKGIKCQRLVTSVGSNRKLELLRLACFVVK